MRKFVLSNAVLAASLIIPAHSQQQQDYAVVHPVIVSDGPYEIKDESGVIGFVVARAGEMVTFAPCVGDSFQLEQTKLVATQNRCSDSPSSDENPFVANCGTVPAVWTKPQMEQAIDHDKPIGTAYYQNQGATDVEVVSSGMKEVVHTINEVHLLKDCGTFTVGFTKNGEPKVGLVQTRRSIYIME